MSLRVTNLSKSYGDNLVIKNFDFKIEPGEIVVLVGESGTGKTTFMRLINNLEKADEGTIELGGITLRDEKRGYSNSKVQREYQNNLGMVFQNYELFPHFTVMENLIEAPLAQKLGSTAELQQKAINLLEDMGLQQKADVYPSTLSGGQKQRVAIARSMMLDPQIICFDEPTSALDRRTADLIGNLIQKIARQGKGILIVTHDMEFSQAYGTRLIDSKTFMNN